MIEIRPAEQRGRGDHGWLDSRHTFSFADYYDARFMGFGPLRVINEDRVQAGQGFGMHSHRDMEIISYVLEGALEHQDSLGNGSVLRPGHVQRMSAGTGVRHSEFNHSPSEPVHFLQIWIIPDQRDLVPSYEERTFADDAKRGRLRLIASREGRDDSVVVHQDVDLYAALLAARDTLAYAPKLGRRLWIQIARGAIDVNGKKMSIGDGAAIIDEKRIIVRAESDAEILLFDMA